MKPALTGKQRMLNAYRGLPNDRVAIAPEFWYYIPAKVLGVDMLQFERDIPHWQALQATFRKYGTEGWGGVGGAEHNPAVSGDSRWEKISDTQQRLVGETRIGGQTFTSTRIYDVHEPSWTETHPVKDPRDMARVFEIMHAPDVTHDFTGAVRAWEAVGEDYLLECAVCSPFSDVLAHFMGFEAAVEYLLTQAPAVLERMQARYIENKVELARRACERTPFESFFVGCSYACNSLIGPNLWRTWDKPVIRAVAEEVHRHGRLLHIHFHGRCIETVRDFAELGLDCVCPFERPPGGDVRGLDGLRTLERALRGRTTMNGNIHTVETLIRGTEADVRREVGEILEAFRGNPRVIVGTGDQVGLETPEENIHAMVDECVRRSRDGWPSPG